MESQRNTEQQATNRVAELLNQLVNYTDNLSDKMNVIKEKHQADFLIAYKNHMYKIRKELQDLKIKAEEQNKQLFCNEKLVTMEKELSFFREECMKLYQKIDAKNKENYELRFKLQELKQEKEHLEVQTKQLMKKLRLLEINQGSEVEQQVPKIDQTFCTTTTHKKQVKRRFTEGNSRLDMKQDLKFDSSVIHQSVIKEFLGSKITSEQDCVDDISNYIKNIEIKYTQKIRQCQQKIANLMSISNKSSILRSDLEHFFLECVESVRRDLIKKKPPNYSNSSYLDSIKDYSVFHKEDKQKILELVLSNEKILVFLYQKIFPNHFSVVLQQVKEESNNIIIDATQRQSSFDKQPKTTREVRSYSQKYQQLEVRKGRLMFKQF